MTLPQSATLGTLLRHLIEMLDGAVEAAYADMPLDYRPRYTPVVRVLLELGPTSIRTISQRAGITHSAASQTVTQMSRHGFVDLRVGEDARERIVALTPDAEAMVPALRRQWAITNTAAQMFDQELSMPLSKLLREAIDALEQHPFSARMNDVKAEAAPDIEASPTHPARRRKRKPNDRSA